MARELNRVPEILELHTVTGDADLLAVVVARSNTDLQRVLDRLAESGDVQRASSVIVLESLFEQRADGLIGPPETEDAES